MTRLARMVFPGIPHHVTQRGNRREAIFFEDGDQEIYRDLLTEQAQKAKVEVWGWCCMTPNHVHLIMTPETANGLGRAVGEGHRRYTNFVRSNGDTAINRYYPSPSQKNRSTRYLFINQRWRGAESRPVRKWGKSDI